MVTFSLPTTQVRLMGSSCQSTPLQVLTSKSFAPQETNNESISVSRPIELLAYMADTAAKPCRAVAGSCTTHVVCVAVRFTHEADGLETVEADEHNHLQMFHLLEVQDVRGSVGVGKEGRVLRGHHDFDLLAADGSVGMSDKFSPALKVSIDSPSR